MENDSTTDVNIDGGQVPVDASENTSIAAHATDDIAAPAPSGWKANNVSDASLAAIMAARGVSDEDDLPEVAGAVTTFDEDEDDDQVTAAGVDSEPPEALNEGQDQVPGKTPKTVPYERLAEKVAAEKAANDKLAAAEARIAEIEAQTAAAERQRAEEAQRAQERQALEGKARAVNATSVEQYNEWNEWAKGEGYGNVENYVAVKQYEKTLESNFQYSDEAKSDLVESKRQLLAAQALIAETQQTQQHLARDVVEREIDAAKSAFGGTLDPELEQQFRMPGVTPQVVKHTVQLFQKQIAPIVAPLNAEITRLNAIIEEARAGIPAAIKERENNAVAKAAATRHLQTRTPSPEGAGGTPPALAAAPKGGVRQAIGSSLMDLMRREGKRTG